MVLPSVLGSSSSRKKQNLEPKSLTFLNLLLLLGSNIMSLLTLLLDDKLEQEVSQTNLDNLFFKEKHFYRKRHL